MDNISISMLLIILVLVYTVEKLITHKKGVKAVQKVSI